MSTKKKRIIIALDQKHLEQLERIKRKLKTKQNSKAIKTILDIINLDEQVKM